MRDLPEHRGPASPFIEIPAAGDAAGERARRRGSSSLSAAWCRVKRGLARVEDSLIGDVIGGASLVLTFVLLFIIAGVM